MIRNHGPTWTISAPLLLACTTLLQLVIMARLSANEAFGELAIAITIINPRQVLTDTGIGNLADLQLLNWNGFSESIDQILSVDAAVYKQRRKKLLAGVIDAVRYVIDNAENTVDKHE